MGQRLNLEIKNGGKTLANCYYHWSGYTTSAIELTNIVLDNLENIKDDNEVIRAVKLLITTGAGIEYSEYELLGDTDVPETKKLSRNDGLIAISTKAIKETQYWAEGSVYIDLSNNTVNFDCFWEICDLDYDEEELKVIKLNSPKTLFNSISNISFEDFKSLLNVVNEAERENNGAFKVDSKFYVSIY